MPKVNIASVPLSALHNKAGKISPAMREYTIELERVLKSLSASVPASTSTTTVSAGGGGSVTQDWSHVEPWTLNSTKAITGRFAYTDLIFGVDGELVFTATDSELGEIY